MSLLRLCAGLCILSASLAQDIPSSIAGHELPSWVPPVLAGTFILVGLLELSFGYKLFRVTLFALGFLAAFLSVAILIMEYVNAAAAPWIGIGVGGAAGLAVGTAGACYPRVGVFLVTAAAGVCVGLIINTAVGYKVPVPAEVTQGLLSGGTALVFGVLSTLFMRIMVVLSTSIVGAFLVIYGTGRLIPAPYNFPNVLDLESELINNTLPAHVYVYLVVWALLAFGGMAVQFGFTGRKRRGREEEKDEWEQAVEDGKFSKAEKDAAGGGTRSKRSGSKRDRRSGSGGGRRAKSGRVSASQRLKAQALLRDYDDGAGGVGDHDDDDEVGGGGGDGYEEPRSVDDGISLSVSLPSVGSGARGGFGGGFGGGDGGGGGGSTKSGRDMTQETDAQDWARGPPPPTQDSWMRTQQPAATSKPRGGGRTIAW